MKKLLRVSSIVLCVGFFLGACQTDDPLYRDVDRMAEYVCELMNEFEQMAMMGEDMEELQEIESRIMEISEKVEALAEEIEEKYDDVPDEELEALLMEAMERHGCYDDMQLWY